ncbi:MAG: hypothetical protein RR224_05210 [Clostridia bacterium]
MKPAICGDDLAVRSQVDAWVEQYGQKRSTQMDDSSVKPAVDLGVIVQSDTAYTLILLERSRPMLNGLVIAKQNRKAGNNRKRAFVTCLTVKMIQSI